MVSLRERPWGFAPNPTRENFLKKCSQDFTKGEVWTPQKLSTALRPTLAYASDPIGSQGSRAMGSCSSSFLCSSVKYFLCTTTW